MSVMIKEIEKIDLSQMIVESTQIELTDRETKLINYCQSMSLSTWVGFNDAELVCAWGIIPPSLLSNEVYLWLHTTKAIKGNQFLFVRHSQRFVEDLLKEYEAIVGHVKIDAEQSKRWLKWLGAKFGASDGKLMTFRIERKWQTR